jgi:hypothetical protein
MPPNFTLLDSSLADIASLMAAMLQAREAVGRRSWAHPQEPTGEALWADVLADPRARKRERCTDPAVKLGGSKASALLPFNMAACNEKA